MSEARSVSQLHPAGPRYRRRPEDTALYRIIQQHLETFVARGEAAVTSVHWPAFVLRELFAFLTCGILAHGFARVHCSGCGKDALVAFSCKRRGFCPSCGGRRMADTAAHLVDRVLPHAPVRQWVLTVSFALGYGMAYDHTVLREVRHPTDAEIGRLLAAFRKRLATRFRRLDLAPPEGEPDGEEPRLPFESEAVASTYAAAVLGRMQAAHPLPALAGDPTLRSSRPPVFRP